MNMPLGVKHAEKLVWQKFACKAIFDKQKTKNIHAPHQHSHHQNPLSVQDQVTHQNHYVRLLKTKSSPTKTKREVCQQT